MTKNLQGQTYSWKISDQPIGSGDAGEVFAASSVEDPDLVGVVKKPARIATAGTIQRQAEQIARESNALALLDGLPKGKAHPPRLLDKAPEFTRGTANYFIVSQTAPGEDLETMLLTARQTGKPFPRRVIITVLDALFDLFSRAHKSGVLWNDVKLNHIYWDHQTGSVSVIDWGNAQFLESSESSSGQSLPRWEDYRQMVASLGGFLQRSAPELYEDLGWAEFEGEDLDSPRISILARRIAYQQQVIALKVMEYQSLIRVVTNGEISIHGLENIREYQQILEQIGAPWDQDSVLKYCESLVRHSLTENTIQTGIKTTALAFDLFPNTLDLSWHLLREIFRQPDILSHRKMPKLANQTLNKNWSRALWTLIEIARDLQKPAWWDQLTPVIRQKALDLVSPPPTVICQRILEWQCTQQQYDENLTKQIETELAGWNDKGSSLSTKDSSPFDYPILEILEEKSELPSQIFMDLRKSFAVGQEAIREVFQSWVNLDWDSLFKALRQVACWDPDRWGFLELAEELERFQAWLKDLWEGPSSPENLAETLDNLQTSRPPLENFLGKPPWFKTLMRMLTAIRAGASIADYQSEIQTWCPWLLANPEILLTDNPAPLLNYTEREIDQTLKHFINHLQTWSDLEGGLDHVAEQIPALSLTCKTLLDQFHQVLSLNYEPISLNNLQGQINRPYLQQAVQVLWWLNDWRQHLNHQDLSAALEGSAQLEGDGWRILEQIRKETHLWHTMITPILTRLANPTIKADPIIEKNQAPKPLVNSLHALREVQKTWQQIYHAGIHLHLLETLKETITNGRTSFLSWQGSVNQSSNIIGQILYHAHLDKIRQVNDFWLKCTHHIHQASLSFTIFSESFKTGWRSNATAGENLLEHLNALETLLVPENGDRFFPDWVKAFSQLTAKPSTGDEPGVLSVLSEDHPFSKWLIQQPPQLS